MLELLRNRTFAAVWFCYTTSVIASAAIPTAITLQIVDHGGVAQLGIVLAARTAGFLVGAVFGGMATDRFPRWVVLAASCGVRGVAALAAASAIAGPFELVAICLALIGAGEGTFRSAYQALIVEIVGPGDRQRANAVNTLSMRLALTAGPVAVVWVYSQCGSVATLTASGLLWLLSAGLVLALWLRDRDFGKGRANGASRNVVTEYAEGLKEALRHRWFVGGLMALTVWLGFGFSIQQLALPFVSRNVFGSDVFIGLSLGAYSAGAICGAFLLTRWTPRRPGSLGFVGLAAFSLVPFSLVGSSPMLIVAAYFIGGVGIELFNVPWSTAIQNEVPKELIGRVSSLDFLVSYGVAPLTLAFLPAAIALCGRDIVTVGCGLLVLCSSLGALAVPGADILRDDRGRRALSG
ncbi:MFS transporter [Mesorhizobium loti]|uniref:MFS transporter n=1 Tax=Rhizobium loti TaxID=381 RepID=UPI0004027ACC|nr:MFS transporter [Mesorhizobium loti]